ncbi:TraR/DksA family transcriptional regulator [Modicisalibacter sp. MOD 31.J]|uniref:TraR/DksA family transcriptional regulator n=1 Tax=Modicisalibacter sp. MOD 31.J TaxID=2831897 RepID=UPI001CCCD924|nr:TraR/DksA family transcriptional regulator [Modicisalibacter sp. MOD 31.J]MBZ9576760.1 TraR/DksA family transcriptional regulator [Modicisalibacter sp. MOD 31.J]
MADNADIAAEISERHLAGALANRPVWIGVDMARAECVDCGEEIPAARREAAPGAHTCIECQGIREMRARR